MKYFLSQSTFVMASPFISFGEDRGVIVGVQRRHIAGTVDGRARAIDLVAALQ